MPMGIVSDSEFESELENGTISITNSNLNISHKKSDTITIDNIPPITPPISPGRNNGDLNVPNVLRKIIGEHSAIYGRAEALTLAEKFGISPSSVSAYQEGATSTTSINNPQEELNTYIRGRKQKLSKKALNKLSIALTKLNEDKLSECDGPQLAHVAQIMSTVVKNLDTNESSNGDNDNNKNKGPNITFVTPIIKSEEAYTFIHTRE